MTDSERCPVSMDDMIDLAFQAGDIMKAHFSPFGMKRVVKDDLTPVTVADKAINDLFVSEMRRISPDIDIFGEEGSDRTASDWQAICDPIDGTFPYTWGMPVSTFMLGVSFKRQPIMGLIYDPFTDAMYMAEKGKGATLMAPGVHPLDRLKVSSAKDRSDRPIVGYVSWPGCPYNILKVCQYLEEHGVTVINFCSIGYIEAAVATGELAATLFPGQHHHDTIQGHIIVEEAGGKVTDVFGNPLHYTDNKIEGHIMSNGHIHDLIVAAVAASQ